MKIKILIVDNDKSFVEALKYSFDKDKYKIENLSYGKEVLKEIKKTKYNLILMDLILPDIKGLELCQIIREKSSLPIIIITRKNEDINKILALEYGADDYLVKPFNILELKARIKAVLRRIDYSKRSKKDESIKIGDFKINSLGRKLNISSRKVDLTGKEFDLFYNLILRPGKIFQREKLLELVWGYDYYGDKRTVDVHIRRIREKIEDDPANPKYILTKWGIGYYFKSN